MDRAATGRHWRGRSSALRSDGRLVVLLMCEETNHHAVQIKPAGEGLVCVMGFDKIPLLEFGCRPIIANVAQYLGNLYIV